MKEFIIVFIILLILIAIFAYLVFRAEKQNSIEKEIEQTRENIKFGRLQ